MDLLSDVLQAVRLNGAYFYRVNAAAPWSVEAPPSIELAPRVKAAAEHLIPYHVVVDGRCWGTLCGAETDTAVLVEAGDVIVLPHGDAHIMSSARGMRPTSLADMTVPPPPFPFPVALGAGDGTPTSLVCGFLACDIRPFNPILAALPRVLHVRGESGGWLSGFARQAVAESESRTSGGDLLLTRLSELMFIEVVRKHISSLPELQTGWLAGLRDPHVGRALSLLHERYAHAWSLVDLARESGLSRSALAERFTHLVGEPPMQYLTRWRMQIAARQLTESAGSIATVAGTVGYESEAAFSRTFKKIVGESPGAWRRARS